MDFLLTTERGIEYIASKEIRELTGANAKVKGEGRLEMHGRPEDILTLNYCSNSLHRVIILLLKTIFEDLKEIYISIKSISFSEYIADDQKFAVRASRTGKHSFTSVDLARVAGQAVIDAYKEEKGRRLKVDLDSPDVVIIVEARGNELLVGIDTTGESLHRRGYRVYQHPASLKSTIAYSLVRIAEWDTKESLFDPFCGSGTICIEAARYACKIPNLFRKNTFLFWGLRFLPHEDYKHIASKVEEEIRKQELSISGCDISPKHIEGAKKNAERIGVDLDFFTCDATKVKLSYDNIITNPPFGLRIGSKRKIIRLYNKFEQNLFRDKLWKRAVVLTARPELFDVEPKKKFNILYGNLSASILVFE
jgi:tRNA (guanine6-N2)-methyltransferase